MENKVAVNKEEPENFTPEQVQTMLLKTNKDIIEEQKQTDSPNIEQK